MFLRLESLEYDNHIIHPDWRLTSDHTPLNINISIFEEHIQTRKRMLVKNSKEEFFIKELIEAIERLNTENIQSKEVFEQIVQLFTSNTERIWYKYSKVINITKHLKDWWDKNCHRDLKTYRQYKQIKDWRRFKGIVRKTKHNFFDLKIQEIVNKKCGP